MRTPWEKTSVASRFFFIRCRIAITDGLSVGPSTPQLRLRLSSDPSRLSSPFASLCLRSYETRSFSVNPSCAVTKLTLAYVRRPPAAYRSLDPEIREASSPLFPGSARQNERTPSRYSPFHSAQPTGKLPIW